MSSKKGKEPKTKPLARELEESLLNTPPELEAMIQKVLDRFAKDMPRATDGALLSSRVNW